RLRRHHPGDYDQFRELRRIFLRTLGVRRASRSCPSMSSLWLIALWAPLIPILGLAFHALELRRDTFFLLVYVQSLAYVDFAPTLASAELNTTTVDRYVLVMFWALVLFQLPIPIIYAIGIRRRQQRLPVDRDFVVSPVRLAIFTIGSIVFGI